jgi:hypothetical protein
MRLTSVLPVPFQTLARLGLALALLAAPVTAATTPPAPAPAAAHAPAGKPLADLPTWVPPPSYSEDLVMETDGKTMTMSRSIDAGRMRTEMNVDGKQFVMIELGDEKGTTLVLMPDQKRAMKQSREGNAEIMAKANLKPAAPDTVEGTPPGFTVEDLGTEKLGDANARKLRLTTEGNAMLMWVDPVSGAPLRMEGSNEGKPVVMEWKNRKVAPQPAANFEAPKDYELTDMDAMMKQMGGMGGMGGLGGMAKGMAGGMAGSMGSSLGGQLGGQLGGMIGGPIGSIAGHYLGGKIGGMLGHKAANAVLH